MTLEEYTKILLKRPILQASDLINKNDRTLLYGFTLERDTWHVYLLNEEIFCVCYEYLRLPFKIEIRIDKDYVPSKRLYPAMCDYEFCKLLSDRGVNLPFTNFTNKEEQTFYGEIL